MALAEHPPAWPRWTRRGYPRRPQAAALEGTVIHLTVQRIMRAFLSRGCNLSSDETAVLALRDLGGYTAVIRESVEFALSAHQNNPRASPSLDWIRARLLARIPEYRRQVQSFVSRVYAGSGDSDRRASADRGESAARHALAYGTYSEIDLQAAALQWIGAADIITLLASHCEIRDLKTGSRKEHHEFQVRVYALLWARDRDRNPAGRLADTLVLSYDSGDVALTAPDEVELLHLEENLRTRTAVALASLSIDPPPARPSNDNCAHCAVRHLSEEYWQRPHRSSVTDV